MAGSVNKVILVGNIGKAPQLFSKGSTVLTFSVATNESYVDKSGERKDVSEWHKVVFFGTIAESLGKSLDAGDKVYIEGKIKSNEYTDKEGVKQRGIEIIGSTCISLSRMKDPERQERKSSRMEQHLPFDSGEEDLPF